MINELKERKQLHTDKVGLAINAVMRVSAMDVSFGNPKIALWLSDECDKLAEEEVTGLGT
jgi:hypothetical protein